MRFDELSAGKKVKNLAANQIVKIIAVSFIGDDFAKITYEDERGVPKNLMLSPEQTAELVEVATSWDFNSDTEKFRWTSEAYRINAAPLFEKFLAVRSSLIEPLPHQISAVYEKMLVPRPLRFVLADDPGAGKTIMTGLLLKELILREDVKRCLIVCPGTLAEQWQDELRRKFQLPFEIATSEKIITAASGNFFRNVNFCIAGLDLLARNKNFREKLYPHWDLIVCDEAHKMSATFQGNKVRRTKRFRLGELLGKITRHFLLLTATPHNGKEKDFYLFMSLVDPDRFAGANRIQGPVDVSDIMRRLVKEDLLTFDGKPLFPERRAYTVNFALSPQEAELYRLVTNYVVDGFNRAEKLEGNRKNSVGFAMTILQRRLASSPLAIFKSLQRRTERLQKILRDKKFSARDDFDADDWLDREEFPNGESELLENDLAERATTAQTIAELRREIETLQKLTDAAKKNFLSGEDKKWRELSELLQVNKKFLKHDGGREKLIIFTEHRDTLEYLRQKISALFGRNESVVAIHGGLNYKERHAVEKNFRQDKNVIVLVATDAAGEGINLQNAHLMINYDLPWNPNRLEQRFGRIHRIGQREVCHLWNLVANETREGQLFFRLLKKLEEERAALGGKVFDILGKIAFDNKPLRELLIEAIRYGDNPKVIRRLDSVVDNGFDAEKIQKLLRERALTEEILGAAKVNDITQKIERSDVYKLQPYFVENFFPEAFRRLGGLIFKRGKGRYEITHVPAAVRDKAARDNSALPERFKRICFDKKISDIAGVEPAEFVALGHPLLKAVCSLMLEKFGDVLKHGTIFVDDNDDGENFRLLFCVEIELRDGRQVTVSKHLHFLEISRDGQTLSTNHAPYLDYRSPTADERKKILSAVKNESWLAGNLDELAADFVAKNLVRSYLEKFSANQKIYLDKLETAVKSRLLSEINFLDERADELKAKDKIQSESHTRQADELAERLKNRLAEISLRRKISPVPPVVVSCALIAPRRQIESLSENIFSTDADARKNIEQIAMHAVTEIERELGNKPVDVSGDKCGYDIESATPDGQRRLIEVKGRTADADIITVTKNEIFAAMNSPDNFILAIVSVADKNISVTYLKNPFASTPDPAIVSINFRIVALLKQGNIILERNFFV